MKPGTGHASLTATHNKRALRARSAPSPQRLGLVDDGSQLTPEGFARFDSLSRLHKAATLSEEGLRRPSRGDEEAQLT